MRIFDIGAREGQTASDRILTVPNLLSLARIAILPVVYLDLVAGRLVRAFVLLAIFATTDWLDGYLARRLDQITRLGTLLDPISDRILFVVVGIGFVVSDLLPLWALIVLLVRDAAVLLVGGGLLLRGASPPAVTRIGKAATFGLMWAFPTFLVAAIAGDGASAPQPVVQTIAWGSLIVSTVLYYLSAGQYAREVLSRSRAGALPADADD
ncbi:MAG: CDP-alcohol phosphatidyltransferase family protein [Nitriliruptoraceae bacterium]|nr:CDP-alcohol phosphatidyltransferase family protein [Nitriliruptoraceae bacterium]